MTEPDPNAEGNAPVPSPTTWELDVEPSAAAVRAADSGASLQSPPAVGQPVQESPRPPTVRQILEALLFVGGKPLSAEAASGQIRGLTPSQFVETLEDLNHLYRRQNRPYLIHKYDQGYAMILRPAFRWVQAKIHGSVREVRLSPAAVEVLSIIAYRQPITRVEIENIRGQDTGALIRLLVRRGLVSVQRGEGENTELRYGTTQRFLEWFGLQDLGDLPQAEELQRL